MPVVDDTVMNAVYLQPHALSCEHTSPTRLHIPACVHLQIYVWPPTLCLVGACHQPPCVTCDCICIYVCVCVCVLAHMLYNHPPAITPSTVSTHHMAPIQYRLISSSRRFLAASSFLRRSSASRRSSSACLSCVYLLYVYCVLAGFITC